MFKTIKALLLSILLPLCGCLQLRLKPDGVLFGWDIERSLPISGCDPAKNATCRGTHFFSPGGDFLETQY